MTDTTDNDLPVDEKQRDAMFERYETMRRQVIHLHEVDGLPEDEASWRFFGDRGFDKGAMEEFVSTRASHMLGLLVHHASAGNQIDAQVIGDFMAATYLDGMAFGLATAEATR